MNVMINAFKLCSHTVAAAEANGELKEFMNWFKTKHSCDRPNLMQLRAWNASWSWS